MIWAYLLGYFVACTVGLVVVLEVFAWLLRHLARLRRPFPLLLGLLLYGGVAFMFALPLIGLEFFQSQRAAASAPFRSLGLVGYLVSLLLAVLFFRRRHLHSLKGLGYFQPRSKI